MPTHWTYCDVGDEVGLFQGDIIEREKLLVVLEEVHRHFCDEKYLAFIVSTQTCDLVVRKGEQCKARHINLAVIRSLEGLVPTIFPRSRLANIPAVYREEEKEDTAKLLQRLLNQNEQAHGMFYLHQDADIGIAVPAVALLRVTIALKAREHYALLTSARCGRLSTAYRNKLGWLAGNLYSRVDTMDWADHEGGEDTANELIKGFIDGTALAERNVWVPDAWVRAALKKGVKIEEIPKPRLLEELRKYQPLPPFETIVGKIREIGRRVLSLLGDEVLRDFQERVRNHAAYIALILDVILLIALDTFGDSGSVGRAVLVNLKGDSDFLNSIRAAIDPAIEQFKKHRGQRELSVLLAFISETPLFSEASISRIREVISSVDVSVADRIERFEERLREERPSSALVSLLQALACEAVNGAVIERLVQRLENDSAVRAALRA